MVTKHDLFILYHMAHREPANVKYLLVEAFACHYRHRNNKAIYLGPYVTRLIRGMGVLHILHLMQVVCGREHLTLRVVRKVDVVVVQGKRVVFAGVEEEEDDEVA